MIVALRFLLIGAILVLVFVFQRIRKSEFEIADSIFWFIIVGVLALFALFPQIGYLLSGLFGFVAPSNFIFLTVIAILFIRVFSLNAKVAHFRTKVNSLIQELALREHENDRDSE